MPESTAQLYPGPQYPGPLSVVAQHALASSGVYPLRELTVEPHNDGLLISGAVSSFYLKQLAQEVVMAATGSVDLVNSVRVTET
ncbi:MAG TPA: BON domain-containing protein [Pirellulales bacterium]|nr:BON domain-containing protein [Pirellulales bacterium]